MTTSNPYEALTPAQQRLCDDVTDLASIDGSDMQAHLNAADASTGDKDAVAYYLDGSGAGTVHRDDDTDGM